MPTFSKSKRHVLHTKWFQESLTHKFAYVWKSEIFNENSLSQMCQTGPSDRRQLTLFSPVGTSLKYFSNNTQQNISTNEKTCQRCAKFPHCTVNGVRWIHRWCIFKRFYRNFLGLRNKVGKPSRTSHFERSHGWIQMGNKN